MFKALLKKEKNWYQTILVTQIYGQLEMKSRYKENLEGLDLFRLEKNSTAKA